MSRLLGLGAPFPEFSLQACVSPEREPAGGGISILRGRH